jgi:hypothetical protein
MGIFSNYEPADFKDKDVKTIVNMSPADVDADFFTKYKEETATLPADIQQAIQFLIDLKGDKNAIYMRLNKTALKNPSINMPSKNTPYPKGKLPTFRANMLNAPAPALPVTPRMIPPTAELQGGVKKQGGGGSGSSSKRNKKSKRSMKSKSKRRQRKSKKNM